MDIQIKFELNEINAVLKVLAKEPYEFSEPLISKIKKQATEQIAEANKPKVPAATTEFDPPPSNDPT